MISVDYVATISEYLSSIIGYGIKNEYSLSIIEDRISFSDMFRKLEQGDYSFLLERTIEKELELVYSRSIEGTTLDTNSIILWLGEAYTKLFFRYHKAIYYIFLYFPIEEMISIYGLYHEMDWTQLYSLFEKRVSEVPLLKKLLIKRNLSANKLSSLTGISLNTINYYCLDDNHLYEAKYSYIDSIALALKVNSNVFLKEIHNYTNSGNYEFDKENPVYRSYLGLLLASYFDLNIKKQKFVLDKDANIFIANNSKLKVLWTESTTFADISDAFNIDIKEIIEKYSLDKSTSEKLNTTLVIFEFNQISGSAKTYSQLNDYGYKDIYIINQSTIMYISKNDYRTNYLPDSVNKSMIELAKKLSGGDFAI